MTTASNIQPFLLSCSPRVGGNSDTAISLFTEKIKQRASNKPFDITYLREYSILPCISCGACEKAALSGELSLSELATEKYSKKSKNFLCCPLSAKDDSSALLHSFFSSSFVCLVSPIYFYFFPAQVKAFIDRLQPLWSFMATHSTLKDNFLSPKKCYTILISGRDKGEKLFEGSLLSLKYALQTSNIIMEPPLLLRGLDKIKDLKNNQAKLDEIEEYAKSVSL